MEKYGFVYIWFDSWRKMYYIGSHWGHEKDGYICSSNRMRDAYRRRPQDFKRRILIKIYTSREELLNEEFKFLSRIPNEKLGKKYYNLRNHKNGHWMCGDEKLKTLKEKISTNTKEAMYRPEVRERYLKALKTRDNKSSDPDVRGKRRKSMMGKNAGKITVKDENGNIFHTTKDDPKWLSGEIWAASKGVKRPILTEEHKTKIKEAGVFKTINSKRISCIHCGTEGNAGQIGRYHNDRCKKIRIV